MTKEKANRNEVVGMFLTYCRKTLVNARTDVLRDGLCTGFYTDADGFWDYGIDLSMKSFMQAKLLRAMLRFQP